MLTFLTWCLFADGCLLIGTAFVILSAWSLLLCVLGAWFITVALDSLLRSWSRSRRHFD